MQGGVPNPRWAQYIQELDENGKALGFKLPNNPFLFRYDEEGGWQDENGVHYNADGIADEQPESQSDEEDDEDELPAHDYGLVDDLEELLREEEEGIVRTKKADKVEKEEKEVKPAVATQNQKEEFDFGKLLEDLSKSAQRLRKGIPSQLFVYFRQKAKFYERVSPEVEKRDNLEEKQKVVRAIKEAIAKKREELIAKNDWLKQEGVFLDYSGDSDEVNFYDRYWYGYIKTTAEKYLDLLAKIGKSQQFKVLEIKTYYALKSKLYLKKGQEKILAHIAGLREKIEAINENQAVTFTFDGLPEQFPISFVYDLVEYAGGKWQEVESVEIKDDFSASVVCLKPTALQVINIEGYNHDKGQFLEISLQSTQPKKDRKFYYIRLDCKFKIHERQLNDTLALQPSREQLAKQYSKEQEEKQRFRLVIGSIPALKRVLMFRGESMNIVSVISK